MTSMRNSPDLYAVLVTSEYFLHEIGVESDRPRIPYDGEIETVHMKKEQDPRS